MVWFNPEHFARQMDDGGRSSMEMAREADEAITRVLASEEHDAATEALCRVIEARDDTGGDPLAVLEMLSRSGVASKWQALHDKMVDLAEMLHTGLPDDTRGDGSAHAERSGQDFYFSVEGGYQSRFRRADIDTGDGPSPVPSEVAARLRDCTARVLEWLKELQRSCGQQAPLVKHDRFVRLCHQVTDQAEPPQQVLALDSPTGTGTASRGRTHAPAAADSETASAPEHSPDATRWGRRAAQAITKLVERQPRLLLILVLAVVLPAAVWGTWHTLADVNRAISGVGASVLALAAARPLLRNLAWATNILLGTPMRVGIWLADTFDTGPADQVSA